MGFSEYEALFITTRNGIFFGLPMMCVGELSRKARRIRPAALALCAIMYIAEVTFVGMHVEAGDDRSMYFTVPLLLYVLMPYICDWKPLLTVDFLGGMSTAVYVMQFGVVSLGTAISLRVQFEVNQWYWLIVYIATVCLPCLFYMLVRNKKIGQLLF